MREELIYTAFTLRGSYRKMSKARYCDIYGRTKVSAISMIHDYRAAAKLQIYYNDADISRQLRMQGDTLVRLRW